MSFVSKILTIGVVALSITSVCSYAQIKHKKTAKKIIRPITLGFQSGRELLFNSSPLIHSKQSKEHLGISNRLVLRKPLNAHFKIETGLSYGNVQTNINTAPGSYKNNPTYKFAIPLTTQYYFLPRETRIKPYLGAGVQYNFNPGVNPNLISPFNTDYPTSTISNPEGTKYISILFTQGMTFEVNTKIEINESFHFLPCEKIIGIDLGIGYKFP